MRRREARRAPRSARRRPARRRGLRVRLPRARVEVGTVGEHSPGAAVSAAARRSACDPRSVHHVPLSTRLGHTVVHALEVSSAHLLVWSCRAQAPPCTRPWHGAARRAGPRPSGVCPWTERSQASSAEPPAPLSGWWRWSARATRRHQPTLPPAVDPGRALAQLRDPAARPHEASVGRGRQDRAVELRNVAACCGRGTTPSGARFAEARESAGELLGRLQYSGVTEAPTRSCSPTGIRACRR